MRKSNEALLLTGKKATPRPKRHRFLEDTCRPVAHRKEGETKGEVGKGFPGIQRRLWLEDACRQAFRTAHIGKK
ncbi:hypothetical protein CDAR_518041 [Caerostris darwini]|uniref:Ribosomal protein L16 n=1 Tax=Caerostris darwini TaxID=1538125 RepID=A0AAV4NH28_9ARAC|nr:hypothetical protein CDAR_518041 [Caerostris darwini]